MAMEDAKDEVDAAFTRKGQRGLTYENAFGGATSFLRRTYTKDLTGVDLAITGVPFDQAVTHRTGTRFGPRAIREASALQPYDPPYGWPTNPLDEMNIIDYGDVAFDYAKTSTFPQTLTDHIATVLAATAGTSPLAVITSSPCPSCAPMPPNMAPWV
jgi:agmatinase